MTGPMAKGSNLMDLVKLARKNREAFCKFLPPETREFMEARILSGSWYPERHLEHLLIAADRVFGKGDLEFCRSLGKRGALSTHQNLYKNFIHPGDPVASLSPFGVFWPLVHNTGNMVVEAPRHGEVRVTLSDFGHPCRATCLTTAGWFEGVVELSGATCQVTEERCRTRGDDACVWFARWAVPAAGGARSPVAAAPGKEAPTVAAAPLTPLPASGEGALAKGSNFIELVKLARKNREGFEKVLPAETRELMQTPILPSSWYPEAYVEKLLVAADRVLGAGDLKFCWTLGTMAAQIQLRGSYRTGLRTGDPAGTLTVLSEIWSAHHNTGTVTVEVVQPGYARCRISDFGHPSLAQCLSLCGWIEGAVHEAGGQGHATQERCRNHGDSACVIGVRWTLAR